MTCSHVNQSKWQNDKIKPINQSQQRALRTRLIDFWGFWLNGRTQLITPHFFRLIVKLTLTIELCCLFLFGSLMKVSFWNRWLTFGVFSLIINWTYSDAARAYNHSLKLSLSMNSGNFCCKYCFFIKHLHVSQIDWPLF